MPLDLESEGEYYTREFRERMRLVHEFFEAEKRAFAASPTFQSQTLALRGMERRMRRQVKEAEKRARLFAQRDLVRIYLQGARAGSGNPHYRFNRTDTANVARLASDLERVFAQAFSQTNSEIRRVRNYWKLDLRQDTTKKSVLRRHRDKILRDYISPKVDSQKYYLTNIGNIARRLGLTENDPLFIKMQLEGRITDKHGEMLVGGKRWKFETYFAMVARANAQRAYNHGFITASQKQGVVAYEVSDGPECGWVSHDDPQKADGMIVGADDARRYSLAHPNCRRTFIPRPDITTPPPRVDKSARAGAKRTRLSQEYRDFQANLGLVGRSLGQIAQNAVADTARGLVADMIADARYRSVLFNRVVQSNQVLRTFDNRVRQVAQAVGRRVGMVPSEREIADNVVKWIDDILENPMSQADPAYVRRILTGRVDANLRRVVNGPPSIEQRMAFQAMDDFMTYQELLNRRDMTHHMLNITNSIEREYGTEWLKRLAERTGGLSDLQDAINRFNRVYAPGNSTAERITRRVTGDIPNRLYKGLLKTPTDKFLPRTERGRVTLVRLSPRMLRADYLGLRYQWHNRFLKVQTTTVNRNRYLNTAQARFVAVTKGVRVTEVVRKMDKNSLFRDVLKYKSRSTLLDEIGYNAGLLTRITLNPSDLLRIGFKFDPIDGWRRPLPQMTLRTPAARVGPLQGARLRLNLNLNRGFVARNATNLVRSQRDPVRRGAQNMRRRLAEQNMAEIIPDGTRVRTVSQELNIVFGDTLSLGQIGNLKLPRAESIGLRGASFVGRMDSIQDARDYLRRHGVEGFLEDMTFISMFAEMRMLGWSWLRIGKTFHLTPDDTFKVARTLQKTWPTYKKEARMSAVLHRLREAAKSGELMSADALDRAISYTIMFEDELSGKTRFRTNAERRRALRAIVRAENKVSGKVQDLETARRIRAYRRLIQDMEE